MCMACAHADVTCTCTCTCCACACACMYVHVRACACTAVPGDQPRKRQKREEGAERKREKILLRNTTHRSPRDIPFAPPAGCFPRDPTRAAGRDAAEPWQGARGKPPQAATVAARGTLVRSLRRRLLRPRRGGAAGKATRAQGVHALRQAATPHHPGSSVLVWRAVSRPGRHAAARAGALRQLQAPLQGLPPQGRPLDRAYHHARPP